MSRTWSVEGRARAVGRNRCGGRIVNRAGLAQARAAIPAGELLARSAGGLASEHIAPYIFIYTPLSDSSGRGYGRGNIVEVVAQDKARCCAVAVDIAFFTFWQNFGRLELCPGREQARILHTDTAFTSGTEL